MWRSLTAGLLFLSGPALLAAQRGSQDVEEEIRRVARQYLDARLANDTATIRQLLATDFVSINSNGAMGDRTGAMRVPTNATPNGDPIQAFELDSMSIHQYGNTAILVGARRVRIAGSLRPGVRFTSVYIRRDDRWVLAATHTTDILQRGTAR